MNDSKHTPGPWEHDGGATGWVGVRAPYKMVASVYGDRDDCKSDDRMVANARLIAAAPEMYEALAAARQQVVTFGGDVIDAALAKAEGR
jgi:hypothetical protein